MAVKDLARKCELVLVIGSINSSNSNRLVEVAREHGARSHLIDNHLQVDEAWLNGVKTVGITSGASAPEELVERLAAFAIRGASEACELRTVDEDVRFMLPSQIRRDLAAAQVEAAAAGGAAMNCTEQCSPPGRARARGVPFGVLMSDQLVEAGVETAIERARRRRGGL